MQVCMYYKLFAIDGLHVNFTEMLLMRDMPS